MRTSRRASRRGRRPLNSVVRSAALIVAFASPLAAQSSQLPIAIGQTRFATGQSVVPYFEGWIRNPDGSFDLVFGYFNRNWSEELVIPLGPDNRVELESAPNVTTKTIGIDSPTLDRGQPTFFHPRRQGWVYRVRVPSTFGKQVLKWTLRANGKSESAYGELLPVEEITERIVMTRGNLNPGDDDPNRPPTVTIAPVADASAGDARPLTALVTDDGLPKPRAPIQRTQAADATRIQQQTNSSSTAARRGLSVGWMQLRGPAKIDFQLKGPIAVADGKATTTARFPVPGTYVVRATANDGGLSTKSELTIVVR